MTRCDFGFHEWNKWEQYQRLFYVYHNNFNKAKDYQWWQKRTCLKCNKMQLDKL